MNDEEIRGWDAFTSNENTQDMPGDAQEAAEEEMAAARDYEEEREEPVEPAPAQRKKKRRHGGKLRRSLVILVILVAAAIIAKVVLDMRVSTGYSVLSQTEREGGTQTNYMAFGSAILHYSSDGASLASSDGTQIWNETYDMDTPVADTEDDAVVIYDQKGTTMCVFNSKGLLGQVTTELPILKARVSSQGMIAAILEDGETTWINFYSTAGETIATAKTRIDSPGYPIDLDVSDNGELLVVSYVYVDGNTPTSYVAFYNFGTTGQNQMDNLVSGYTYTDVLVPQVRFLSNDTAVAIRDDGITLYKGSSIPAESFSVDAESEIISCFICDSSVGLVMANQEEGDDPYRMQLYSLKGKCIADKTFQSEYTTIRAEGKRILLYNDKQLSIFDTSGREKFHGTIEEGTIQDVCTISKDRFLVVMNESIATIKIR